jgi:hypothetical protein
VLGDVALHDTVADDVPLQVAVADDVPLQVAVAPLQVAVADAVPLQVAVADDVLLGVVTLQVAVALDDAASLLALDDVMVLEVLALQAFVVVQDNGAVADGTWCCRIKKRERERSRGGAEEEYLRKPFLVSHVSFFLHPA